MRDETYRRDQIPAYGGGGQLALVERGGRLLRMSQLGNALAVVAVLAALAAVLTYPAFEDGVGRGWAIAAFVCSVLLLAVCTFQHLSWQQAMAVWKGHGTADLEQLGQRSFVAQIVSYVVVAAAVAASVTSIVIASWLATSSVLAMIALFFMIAAQVLAGVQYVRASGPPGALPAHMHKAIASQQRRG